MLKEQLSNSLHKPHPKKGYNIPLQFDVNSVFREGSSVFRAVNVYMDRVKRIWYLSPMRAAKVQASLRIRAVSPEPPLLAHTSSESRGTFRQKARSLTPLNGWACAVEICHDGMLEDTNSLDGAHILIYKIGRLSDTIPTYHATSYLMPSCHTGLYLMLTQKSDEIAKE